MPDKKEIWLAPSTIERHVTSRYMAAKFLDLTIFLDGDSHSYYWTMEEKHELLFCSWVQSRSEKSNIHILFSLSYLQDHGLLISRDYATMVTRPNDFSSPLVYDLMEPRPIIKINENILGRSKTELDIFGVGSNSWIRNLASGRLVSIENPASVVGIISLCSYCLVLCMNRLKSTIGIYELKPKLLWTRQ